MKALRIPPFILILSIFIVGIQSQAEPKPSVPYFQYLFPNALSDLQSGLATNVVKINEAKELIGRSSAKSSQLLDKCVKVISYLQGLLYLSNADILKCTVPGAKLDSMRGLCYLLVTTPPVIWEDAEEYCHNLGGVLLQPMPLDTTLGTTLTSLFPELLTTAIDSALWIDGSDGGNGFYVYENGFITSISTTSAYGPLMDIPVTATPSLFAEDDDPDDEHIFICQFNAITVLPPFKKSYVGYDDDTYLPDRKYMADVESPNDGYYPSGEYTDGYGNSEGGYTIDEYLREGELFRAPAKQNPN